MFRNFLKKSEKEVFKNVFGERFFEDREKYFDVIVFFSYILKREDFLETIQCLSDDKGGCSFDYLGCTLPSIFDSKEDEGYFENGALFFWNEEEIWIDDEMFIRCIELAGDIYFENHHSEVEKVVFNQSLQKIKEKRKINV